MFYADSFTGKINLDNYTVRIKHGGKNDSNLGTFVGLIDNEELSWDFTTGLDSGGSLFDGIQEAASQAGGIPAYLAKGAEIVNSIHKALTGASIGESLVSTSIRRTDSKYGSLPIAITCTFFKGLKLRDAEPCPSFKDFMRKLTKIHLPTSTGGYLRTPQMTWDTYKKLIASKAIILGNDFFDAKKELWEVRIGNVFQSGGFWMTGAKVSHPNKYDSTGQPLIWKVEFTFEYFKQLTQDENPFV